MIYEEKIQKPLYNHQALADIILAQPWLTNIELGKLIDRTPVWVSYVKNSGSFRKYINERKADIIDPVLTQSIEDRLNGMATESMDLLMDKLQRGTISDALAIECLKTSTKALGYGVRDQGVQIQNNFVVAMPGKIKNAGEWAAGYKGGGLEAGPREVELEGGQP